MKRPRRLIDELYDETRKLLEANKEPRGGDVEGR